MALPGISITEADGKIFLRAQPNPDRGPLDSGAIAALLKETGHDGCAFDEVALAAATESCNTRLEPFLVQLGERHDAKIAVAIAADEMSAEVTVTDAQGGKEISFEGLIEALRAAGVVSGIDEAVALSVCQASGLRTVPIARGVVPQDGTDAVFEELIPDIPDRAPKLDESGLIDYREHGSIVVVHAGTVLMRRHPATTGIDGHTVRGRILPARPGRDEPFAAQLPGTQRSANDPNVLEAAVTGQPVKVDNGLVVEQVLKVAEVNMATGNIHFDGSVEVTGDVLQGMKIDATGDIFVSGMVDGGILNAGANISIVGGVIAHAKVHATGSVTARFGQSAEIHAGTVLVLTEMALDCDLLSLNQIVVGSANPARGRLVGGSASAAMLVSVPLLGSSKAGVTKIVVGTNPDLTAKYTALEKRIDQEKANEEALEKLIKQMVALKDPKGLLPRLKVSRQHAMQVWGQSLLEKKELEQQIALTMTAKVSVGVAVEGAVDLCIGSQSTRLRREFSGGAFSLDIANHVVVFADVSGTSNIVR
jgi:uncharacterized protein (DUF342 family)